MFKEVIYPREKLIYQLPLPETYEESVSFTIKLPY